MAILRNRLFLLALALLAAFFLGFLPQYVRTRALQSELNEATIENRRMHLRDLAALAYVQAVQKNYGLAARTTTEFFDEVQRMAGQAPTAERRRMYEEIYSYRDSSTARLAKGDPGVLSDLETVYLKTRSATTP